MPHMNERPVWGQEDSVRCLEMELQVDVTHLAWVLETELLS